MKEVEEVIKILSREQLEELYLTHFVDARNNSQKIYDENIKLKQDKNKSKEHLKLILLGILEDISMRKQYDIRNCDLYDDIYKFIAEQYNSYKEEIEDDK